MDPTQPWIPDTPTGPLVLLQDLQIPNATGASIPFCRKHPSVTNTGQRLLQNSADEITRGGGLMSPPVLAEETGYATREHHRTLETLEEVWDISIRKSRHAKVHTETHTRVSSNVWCLWRNLESRGRRCPSVPPCPMFTCCSPLAEGATDSAAPTCNGTYQRTTPRANKKRRWGGSVRIPVSGGMHGYVFACVRACARANGFLSVRLCECWACCCGCPAYNRVDACARVCVCVSECRCVLVCVRVRGSVSECTRVCVRVACA